MKISIIVEADYNDLHDQQALKKEDLTVNLAFLAKRIEDDYKHRRSEQNKYNLFYQVYRMDAGALPARKRRDDAAQQVLRLAEAKHPSQG